MTLLTLLLPAAVAADEGGADPTWGLAASAGLEFLVNDPFLHQPALRLGAQLTPLPWLGLEVAGALARGGEATWSAETRALVADHDVVPDLSYTLGRADASLHLMPLRVTTGEVTSRLGASAGAGWIRTIDDDTVLIGYTAEERTETIPAWSLGVAADARRGRWGFRVRGELWRYQETHLLMVDEDPYEREAMWVGADATFALR